MRLAGHTLQSEGAAYYWDPHFPRPRRVQWHTIAGEGFGVCSCGIVSPVLGSGQARKDWHSLHKAEVRASQ